MSKRIILLLITLTLVIVISRPVAAASLFNFVNVHSSRSLIRNLEAAGFSSLQSLLGCTECFSHSAGKDEIPAFDQLIKMGRLLDHDDARWNYLVGFARFAQGDLESARTAFEETLIADDDGSSIPYFLVGLAYELGERRDVAVQAWRRDPYIAHFFLGIGNEALYQHENPPAALDYLRIAAEIDPSQCEPRYRLGVTWMELGDPARALQALSGAETLRCPDWFLAEISYLRGKLYAESGRFEEAIEELRRALRLNPRDPKTLVLLGDALIEADVDVNEAYALLTEAVTLAPDNIWPYIHLCLLERRQENLSDALRWCGQAIDRFPEDPLGYHYAGVTQLEAGNIDEAITWFERALALDDRNPNTWNRLGDAYRESGETARAVEVYHTVLEIDPGNLYAQRRLSELDGE